MVTFSDGTARGITKEEFTTIMNISKARRHEPTWNRSHLIVLVLVLFGGVGRRLRRRALAILVTALQPGGFGIIGVILIIVVVWLLFGG